ncbi:MAG: bifunctional oligoribonuclease/PAP phosphatase NrnA [Candidatus Gracilibacteria bacterium]|jgi:phosphoesterase RecJ-like protein
MKELFREANNGLIKASKILVVSHRKPDSDTLGAALSLKIWLEKMGKAVTLACSDKPSKVFSFLPFVGEYVDEFELKDFDYMICTDCGASYMTNFHLKYPDFFNSGITILNIDHHASNDNFGTINIVDVLAPSATTIVYRFFKFLGVEIDKDMATCLLSGVYSDTGSFMHSNTSQEVFEIASDLILKGADFRAIVKLLFKSNTVNGLRLWGRVMEKAFKTPDDVVVSVIKEDEYSSCDASPDQLSGVIDYLNMVPGARFAVLLNEDRKGNVKGSFRTRLDDVDLSKVVADFGGGGHSKASGFSMKGKLVEEVKYSIVDENSNKKVLEF